jgi:hypothetical protein
MLSFAAVVFFGIELLGLHEMLVRKRHAVELAVRVTELEVSLGVVGIGRQPFLGETDGHLVVAFLIAKLGTRRRHRLTAHRDGDRQNEQHGRNESYSDHFALPSLMVQPGRSLTCKLTSFFNGSLSGNPIHQGVDGTYSDRMLD